MNRAVSKEELAHCLDNALTDVTEKTAGVRLYRHDQPLMGDLCTVHINFDMGYNTSLTLCAEKSMLYRMAANAFHEEEVNRDDLEEFSKEYLNVLCGRLAAWLFKEKKISAHFGAPVFHEGRFTPEGKEAQFVLTYADEAGEGAEFMHHIPVGANNSAVN